MSKMILRCVRSDMTSTNGFRWPRPDEDLGHGPGVAVSPEWSPIAECGHGLHGWLGGAGDPSISSCVDDPSAVWLVVEVEEADIVRLEGKVKYPRGRVVFAGDRHGATQHLHAHGQADPGCMWIALTGGRGSTFTGGDDSTLAGGDYSTITGGYRSTLLGGYRSTLTGGHDSTLTGGRCSTITGGHWSTLTGGPDSTLTGGDY